MDVEAVIGLEIHAQLRTRTKIFCACSTAFGAEPNTNVCPVCLGLPGALPVLNARAVELGVRAGLALGCAIQTRSIFARKNYFYPDLPKGYQISQYERPLATDGVVEYAAAGGPHRVGITRVHLEEDAGKSLHEGFPDSDRHSYVDFNRSGVPLIEIVTEPDLRSAAAAADFFGRLRSILMALDVTDGNMEEGSLRCDANVSVRPVGQTRLGVKTEIKNLNSFRFLQRALEHEIARHSTLIADGEAVVQETRLWNSAGGFTVAMRSKEEAHDYRYFPEPDLPPIEVSAAAIERWRTSLPELPEARRARLVETYALADAEAEALGQSRELTAYFEATVSTAGSAKAASNWIMGELARKMNELGIGIVEVTLAPARLGELIRLVEQGVVSGTTAKQVFETMYETGRAPGEIVEAEGLGQIDDEARLAAMVQDAIAAHPGPAGQYRGGKQAAIGFLVGQVMAASGGKANPRRVNALLRAALAEGAGGEPDA